MYQLAIGTGRLTQKAQPVKTFTYSEVCMQKFTRCKCFHLCKIDFKFVLIKLVCECVHAFLIMIMAIIIYTYICSFFVY